MSTVDPEAKLRLPPLVAVVVTVAEPEVDPNRVSRPTEPPFAPAFKPPAPLLRTPPLLLVVKVVPSSVVLAAAADACPPAPTMT